MAVRVSLSVALEKTQSKLEKEPTLWGCQWSWRRGIKGKWKELPSERLGRLYRAV